MKTSTVDTNWSFKVSLVKQLVDIWELWKQAGAELGQAQLKLELGFISITI